MIFVSWFCILPPCWSCLWCTSSLPSNSHFKFPNWNINAEWHFRLNVKKRHYSSNLVNVLAIMITEKNKVKAQQFDICPVHHLSFVDFWLTKWKYGCQWRKLNKLTVKPKFLNHCPMWTGFFFHLLLYPVSQYIQYTILFSFQPFV
jgi:hypothetical protein